MKTNLKLLFLLLFLVNFKLCSANKQKRAEQVLNEVWNEVSKRHYDSGFKKKYQKLYDKFKPSILKVRSDAKLAAGINKLLKALGQSHIVLMPPEGTDVSKAMAAIRKNTAPAKKTKRGGKPQPDLPADTGIHVLQAGDKICVARVRRNSPAAQAGIKPGAVIVSINGIKLHPKEKLYLGWAVMTRALLSGRPGSKVTIEYMNSGNIKRKAVLPRQLNGEKWFQFGILPRSYSDFYAEVLPGNIGYVRFVPPVCSGLT